MANEERLKYGRRPNAKLFHGLTAKVEDGETATFLFQLASDASSFPQEASQELVFADLNDNTPPNYGDYCGLVRLSPQPTITVESLMIEAGIDDSNALKPVLLVVVLIGGDIPADMQLIGDCPLAVVFVADSTRKALTKLEDDKGAFSVSVKLTDAILARESSEEFDTDEDANERLGTGRTSPSYPDIENEGSFQIARDVLQELLSCDPPLSQEPDEERLCKVFEIMEERTSTTQDKTGLKDLIGTLLTSEERFLKDFPLLLLLVVRLPRTKKWLANREALVVRWLDALPCLVREVKSGEMFVQFLRADFRIKWQHRIMGVLKLVQKALHDLVQEYILSQGSHLADSQACFLRNIILYQLWRTAYCMEVGDTLNEDVYKTAQQDWKRLFLNVDAKRVQLGTLFLEDIRKALMFGHPLSNVLNPRLRFHAGCISKFLQVFSILSLDKISTYCRGYFLPTVKYQPDALIVLLEDLADKIASASASNLGSFVHPDEPTARKFLEKNRTLLITLLQCRINVEVPNRRVRKDEDRRLRGYISSLLGNRSLFDLSKTTWPAQVKHLTNFRVEPVLNKVADMIKVHAQQWVRDSLCRAADRSVKLEVFLRGFKSFDFLTVEVVYSLLEKYTIDTSQLEDGNDLGRLFQQMSRLCSEPAHQSKFQTLSCKFLLRYITAHSQERHSTLVVIELLKMSNLQPFLLGSASRAEDNTSGRCLDSMYTGVLAMLKSGQQSREAQEKLEELLEAFGNAANNPLRDVLLESVTEVIIPSAECLRVTPLTSFYATFMETIVQRVATGLKSAAEDVSPKLKFTASVLNRCVQQMPADSILFPECPQLAVYKPAASACQKLSDELEVLMEPFLSWLKELGSRLSRWLFKCEDEGDVTVAELKKLKHAYDNLAASHAVLYKLTAAVLPLGEGDQPVAMPISNKVDEWVKNVDYLSEVISNLVYPHCERCDTAKRISLCHVLDFHSVQYDKEKLLLWQKCLEPLKTEAEPDDPCSGHSVFSSDEAVGLQSPPPVHSQTTLKTLKSTNAELHNYLGVLQPYLKLLMHFYCHPSFIFTHYLKRRCADMRSTEDGVLSLEHFGKCLDNTQAFLHRLLEKGAATLSELGPLPSDEVDIDKGGIQPILYCSEFDRYRTTSKKRIEDIRNALDLVQYMPRAQDFCAAVRQYNLTKVIEDPSRDFKKLEKEVDKVTEDDLRGRIDASKASQKLQKLQRLLRSVKPQRLVMFKEIQRCNDVVAFGKAHNLGDREEFNRFTSKYNRLSAQLRADPLSHHVLPYLLNAMRTIRPLLDHEDMASLLSQLDDDHFKLVSETGFKELEIVQSNINNILLWFDAAEGDTLESLIERLDRLLNTGKYIFYFNTTHIADATIDLDQEVSPPVTFKAHYNVTVSSKDGSTDVSSGKDLKDSHLDEFVQLLGFMRHDQYDSHFSRMEDFLDKHKMFREMRDLYCQLVWSGHPEFVEHDPVEVELSCSMKEIGQQVGDLHDLKKSWDNQVSTLHRTYSILGYFTLGHVMTLHKQFKRKDFLSVAQAISFLLDPDFSVGRLADILQSIEDQDASRTAEACQSALDHMQYVFNYCMNVPFFRIRFVPHTIMSLRAHAQGQRPVHLHMCSNFTESQIFRMGLKLYERANRKPQPYEVLMCQPSTNREKLQQYLYCIDLQHGLFVVANVVNLAPALREFLINGLQLTCNKKQWLALNSQVHIIDSTTLISQEAQWMEVHVESAVDLAVDPGFIRDFISCHVQRVELVRGQPGNGKTFYINKQMKEAGKHCVLAVNEGFKFDRAIAVLQEFCECDVCSVHVNITSMQPSTESDASQEAETDLQSYQRLMSRVNWFFMSLLIFGCVQDPVTHCSFRLPGGAKWCIYVEVPSQSFHFCKDDAGKSVKWPDSAQLGSMCEQDLQHLRAVLPVFELLGKVKDVTSSVPYDVHLKDEDAPDVGLICKFLNAYWDGTLDSRKRPLRPGAQGPVKYAVKLSDHLAVPPSNRCSFLLDKYIPSDLKHLKIFQRMFLRYLERGFSALNSAREFNIIPHRQDVGKSLVNAMIREAEQFCNVSSEQRSFLRPTVKLLYNEIKEEFDLLSFDMNAFQIGGHQDLQKLCNGHLHDLGKKTERRTLDTLLGAVLNIQVDRNGELADINDEEYVLTPDYLAKMVNIHERKKCGIPVIIEGETGVGKTSLVQMLSVLWNTAFSKSHRLASDNMETILRFNLNNIFPETIDGVSDHSKPNIDMSLFNAVRNVIVACVKPMKSRTQNDSVSREDVARTCREIPSLRDYLFKYFTSPESCLLNADQDVLDKAVHDLSPDSTIDLMMQFLNAPPVKTFFKLNVHGALSVDDLIKFIEDAASVAEKLSSNFTLLRKGGHSSKSPPNITVFLDEVNSSMCGGIIKELLVDHTLQGKPMPKNMFFVAACNPHRSCSAAIRKEAHRDDWKVGFYYVKKLYHTMDFLKWDYGALEEREEMEYIEALLRMRERVAVRMEKNHAFSARVEYRMISIQSLGPICQLIARSQAEIRQYAKEILLRCTDCDEEEAALRARATVSQRDIQRVLEVTKYFRRLKTDDDPVLAEVPELQSILAAIGVVYYLRLDETYRSRFAYKISGYLSGGVFTTTFTEVMDSLVKDVEIPTSIAMTDALKENVFAVMVSVASSIPLIMVGEPGSSKTLSVALVVANLRGEESSVERFKNTSLFPSVELFHYQCSRKSTSQEISRVFEGAELRQEQYNRMKMKRRTLVFMDEAGLPERSHESLKSLHFHLDKPKVAFVAISNTMLDAAKTNRAIQVYRPCSTVPDLEKLATKSLGPARLQYIPALCKAYNIIRDDTNCFSGFFGLRDFMHLALFLGRKMSSTSQELSPELLLKGLERNFGGRPMTDFINITETFMKCLWPEFETEGHSVDKLLKEHCRGLVKILQEAVRDRRVSAKEEAVTRVRYKLIIDTSHDESLLRLLMLYKTLVTQSKSRCVTCSEFPADASTNKFAPIAFVKHAAMGGLQLILSHSEAINESLYDLFNQYFRSYDKKYFCQVAVGTYSQSCEVDPEFQCVVHVQADSLKRLPLPMLNRFEKYYLSVGDFLTHALRSFIPGMADIFKSVCKKVSGIAHAFGGLASSDSTVNSVLLDLLPKEMSSSSVFHCNAEDQSLNTVEKFALCVKQSIASSAGCSTDLWLKNLESFLQQCELCLPESIFTSRDLSSDAVHILEQVERDLPQHSDYLKKIKKDPSLLVLWLKDAVLFLRRPVGHSSVEVQCAVSILSHWVEHVMCMRLLQVATPDALLRAKDSIPRLFERAYLQQQEHLSLAELANQIKQRLPSSEDGERFLLCRSLSKVMCFTAFLKFKKLRQLSKQCPDASVFTVFFEGNRSALEAALSNFLRSSSRRLFVLVFDPACTVEIINHCRLVVEEREKAIDYAHLPRKALIAILPKSPANQILHKAFFVSGWEALYIQPAEEDHSQDITLRSYLQLIWLGGNDEDWEMFFKQVEKHCFALLTQNSCLDSIVARVPISESINGVFNNPDSDITTRAAKLKKLMMSAHFPLAQWLSKKFSKQLWVEDDKTPILKWVLYSLAKHMSPDHSLSLQEEVQASIGQLFTRFCSLMIFKLNDNFDLDLLMEVDPNSNNADEVDLLKMACDLLQYIPMPSVEEYMDTGDWFGKEREGYENSTIPRFPFFKNVYQQMQQALQQALHVHADAVKETAEGSEITESSPDESVTSLLVNILEKEKHTFPMAAIAKHWVSSNINVWYRYLTDFAVWQFGAKPDSDFWCAEETKFVVDVWLRLLPENVKNRFSHLHVLAHCRQDQLSQVVTLFNPLSAMRCYRCLDGYERFLSKVRGESSKKQPKPSHSMSAKVTAIADLPLSASRLDTLFFCGVVFGHLNQRLRNAVLEDKGLTKEVNSWYQAVQIVVNNMTSQSVVRMECSSQERYELDFAFVVYAFLTSSSTFGFDVVVGKVGLFILQLCVGQNQQDKAACLTPFSCIKKGLDFLAKLMKSSTKVNRDDAVGQMAIFVDRLVHHFYSRPSGALGYCKMALAVDVPLSETEEFIMELSSGFSSIKDVLSDDLSNWKHVCPSFSVCVSLLTDVLRSPPVSTMPIESAGGADMERSLNFFTLIKELVEKALDDWQKSTEAVGYVPFFYSALDQSYSKEVDKQPLLANVYYGCCYEQFSVLYEPQTTKTTLASILEKLQGIGSDHQPLTTALSIEKQALTQIFLERLALGFWLVHERSEDLQVTTSEVSDGAESIVSVELRTGHRLSFLAHLYRAFGGSRALLRFFNSPNFKEKFIGYTDWLDVHEFTEESLFDPDMPINLAFSCGDFSMLSEAGDTLKDVFMKIAASVDHISGQAKHGLAHYTHSKKLMAMLSESDGKEKCHVKMLLALCFHRFLLLEKGVFPVSLWEILGGVDEKSLSRPEQRVLQVLCCRTQQDEHLSSLEYKHLHDIFVCPQSVGDSDLAQVTVLLAAISLGLPENSCFFQTLLLDPGKFAGCFLPGNKNDCEPLSDGFKYDAARLSDEEWPRPVFRKEGQGGLLAECFIHWANHSLLAFALLCGTAKSATLAGMLPFPAKHMASLCIAAARHWWNTLQDLFNLNSEEFLVVMVHIVCQFFSRMHDGSWPSGLQVEVFASENDAQLFVAMFNHMIMKRILAQLQKGDLFEKLYRGLPLERKLSHWKSAHPCLPSMKQLYCSLVKLSAFTPESIRKNSQFLAHFMDGGERYLFGGWLLPEAVNLYSFFQSSFSHRLSSEAAHQLTVAEMLQNKQLISPACGRLWITNFKHFADGYNQYMSCLLNKDLIVFPDEVSEDMLFSDFLSGPGCKDVLYQLIEHLRKEQNRFLDMARDCYPNQALWTSLSVSQAGLHNCLLGRVTALEGKQWLSDGNHSLAGCGRQPDLAFFRVLSKCFLGYSNAQINSPVPGNLFDLDMLSRTLFEQYVAVKARFLDNVHAARRVFVFHAPAEGMGALSVMSFFGFTSASIKEELQGLQESIMDQHQRNSLWRTCKGMDMDSIRSLLAGLQEVVRLVKLEMKKKSLQELRGSTIGGFLGEHYHRVQKQSPSAIDVFKYLGVTGLNGEQASTLYYQMLKFLAPVVDCLKDIWQYTNSGYSVLSKELQEHLPIHMHSSILLRVREPNHIRILLSATGKRLRSLDKIKVEALLKEELHRTAVIEGLDHFKESVDVIPGDLLLKHFVHFSLLFTRTFE